MSKKCFCFSDIRGDYRLLYTLLTQVTKVATFDSKNNVWDWNPSIRDTTVICLGNFVDRFGKSVYTRLVFTTEQAIQDELRILYAFESLIKKQTTENGNNFIILSGDHELGNVLNLDSYETYQMAFPDNSNDQKQRHNFNKKYLLPFLENYSNVLTKWNGYQSNDISTSSSTVYFSHAGLSEKWFETFLTLYPIKKTQKSNIIDHINNIWSYSLKNIKKNGSHLQIFNNENSPFFSSCMSLDALNWDSSDKDYIVTILGKDPMPKFVISDIPIQKLYENSLIYYSYSYFPKKSNVSSFSLLTSLENDMIFHLHNAMADVFCAYEDVSRIPQVLSFNPVFNSFDTILYINFELVTLSNQEYIKYSNDNWCNNINDNNNNNNISSSSSLPLQTSSELFASYSISPEKLSDMQIDFIIPFLNEKTKEQLRSKHDIIQSSYLLLFDQEASDVLLVYNTETKNWSLPGGLRKKNKTPWGSILYYFKYDYDLKTNNKPLFLEFEQEKGSHFDYLQKTRFYFQQLHKTSFFKRDNLTNNDLNNTNDTKQNNTSKYFIKWVPYNELFDYNLPSFIKNALCQMIQEGIILQIHAVNPLKICPNVND